MGAVSYYWVVHSLAVRFRPIHLDPGFLSYPLRPTTRFHPIHLDPRPDFLALPQLVFRPMDGSPTHFQARHEALGPSPTLPLVYHPTRFLLLPQLCLQPVLHFWRQFRLVVFICMINIFRFFKAEPPFCP